MYEAIGFSHWGTDVMYATAAVVRHDTGPS